MLVTLWGQTVTCMLLLTSYFCFYFQRWRESVVSTFWDSINPKVIFGTWYQIIKGIFCCSLYIFAAFVWKAVVVRLFPRVLNLNNQTIESNAGTVNTTPALIYLQIKSPTWTCIFMITTQNKKTLFYKGVVACTCKTTYSCACTYNSSHLWSNYYSGCSYMVVILMVPVPYYTYASYSLRQKSLPSVLLESFNSHEWSRQNFSLQYRYNIKHRSDENKVKYQ